VRTSTSFYLNSEYLHSWTLFREFNAPEAHNNSAQRFSAGSGLSELAEAKGLIGRMKNDVSLFVGFQQLRHRNAPSRQ
jgi:hypothetical protein